MNGHAGFVHGYFVKGFVVASHFQGNQSTVAVTNEEGRARLSLQREHVLTLFDDAVIVTLRAALASSAALDGVDRKMLGQGAREGSVVGSHGEDAGNHKNRWPASHGKIANLGPILGEHDVAGILKERLIHRIAPLNHVSASSRDRNSWNWFDRSSSASSSPKRLLSCAVSGTQTTAMRIL